MPNRFVFDVESDGLFREATRIHCAVLHNIDTNEVLDFKPKDLSKFFKLYAEADVLIGHNIIGFDVPLIQKLYGVTTKARLVDTMVLGRMAFPDIKALDFPLAKAWKRWREAKEAWDAKREAALAIPPTADPGEFPYPPPKEFPGNFVGAHSLEAWGYRLGGERKGDYSKECKDAGIDPWAEWSQAMHDYMIQDALVNTKLLRFLVSRKVPRLAQDLEMDVQALCARMERNGWPFDTKAAQELYATLAARRQELEVELAAAFPPWDRRLEDFMPKRANKTKGYIAGVPVERWETVEFNPASREHIADRLKAKHGWEPSEFTDSGQAKVDDEVLSQLPYPEAKVLAEYFVVLKRIGQLAEGTQAWLKQVTKEGFIHARYNTMGAVTSRATHSNPNIAQVPSVGAEYGRDCRVLFHVPKDWGLQLGADQSGLELRALASYLFPLDGGAYMEVVLNGDVHWENAKALFDLPDETERDSDDPSHTRMRNVAKTYIYAFLYGAGDGKLGSIIGEGKAAGSKLRKRFLAKFPALKRLIDIVQAAAQRGYLKGLDGRHVPVRSPHAALNTLLQSAGAILCKKWIVLAEEKLQAAGLRHGWDGDYVFLGWIHDEAQLAVRGPAAEQVSAILRDAGREAGEAYATWHCPTAVEVISGHNWADCH